MLADIVNIAGEHVVLVAGGVLIGILFGAMAQQSRFCLRAAAVEFARGGMFTSSTPGSGRGRAGSPST